MDWLRRRFRPSPAAPAPEVPQAAQRLRAARAALHAGDGREALRHIDLGIAADPAYVPLYKLVTTTYALLPTGQDEWKLYAAAAERPNEAQPFLELGRHFIAQSSQRIAVPLLERARALAPNDVAVARALAEALLGECRPRDARECLQSVDPAALEADPEARTVLARARLLCGETEGILDEAQGETRDQLAEALERRATVAAPDESARSLRAWHFIQYGAALLHVSAAEGGRYDFVSLGEEDLARLVTRLQRLLETLERPPEVVIALPDTDSVRVAEIVSRQTGVPLEGLPSSMVNRSTRQMMEDVERERVLLARTHSLVVAADNRKLEAYPAYQHALPGQTAFALTHYWLGGASLTPDVSGLLCRAAVFPWTTVQKPVAPPSPVSRVSAPDPPPRELKARKVDPPAPAGVPEDDAAFEEALAFYQERRELLKGGAQGQRRPFRRESPIQSTYAS
ncbi:MAG TPA: tetratricopeptide repeat protein [Chloroflexota bacterium]|nr:tetratricopeptide repeat protein [Chloroflexota bacterium]